jgi:hypothetical protein
VGLHPPEHDELIADAEGRFETTARPHGAWVFAERGAASASEVFRRNNVTLRLRPTARVDLHIGGATPDELLELEAEVTHSGNPEAPCWKTAKSLHAPGGALEIPRDVPVQIQVRRGYGAVALAQLEPAHDNGRVELNLQPVCAVSGRVLVEPGDEPNLVAVSVGPDDGTRNASTSTDAPAFLLVDLPCGKQELTIRHGTSTLRRSLSLAPGRLELGLLPLDAPAPGPERR